MDKEQPEEIKIETAAVKKQKRLAKLKDKKLTLILFVLVLISGAILAALYMYRNTDEKTATQTASNTQNTTVPASDPILYFQVDTKLVAFNTKDKTSTTLSADIPEGAQVIDVFGATDTWRLYYLLSQTTDSTSKSTIGYMEKGASTKILKEIANDYPIVQANAREKVATYTILPDFGESSTKRTTRTYLLALDKTEKLIFESSESESVGAKTLPTDPNNFLFYPRDISPNGKKVLFGLSTCYQCDGPPRAVAFELDIASKATDFVHTDTESSGSFSYMSNGNVVVNKSKNNNLGAIEGPLKETYSKIVSPGAAPQTLADINESTWSGVSVNGDVTLAAVSLRGTSYNENFETTLDGVYEIAGPEVSSWKKFTIANQLKDATAGVSVGNIAGDCFGLISSQPYTTTTVRYVGAVCGDANSANYYAIDELTAKSDSSQYKYLIAF